MAIPHPRRPTRPPGIYRAAEGLRTAGLIVLVVTLVFVGVVAYSAVQVVRTAPRVVATSVTVETNETVGVTASIALSNPTIFPIQKFVLQFRILNSAGELLVASTTGPATIGAGASRVLPITLFLPVSAGGASLLTQDQYLEWNIWGNGSYGLLFTASFGVQTNRSWGAPFANLSVAVGPPAGMGGATDVPVTVAFSDDASFADVGNLTYEVVSSSGQPCSTGAFPLDVTAGSPYSRTQDAGAVPGCNPAGGHVMPTYVGSGFTAALPPEPIP